MKHFATALTRLTFISRLFSPVLFFFFQAEDGIRDVAVTGVQTCALPISLRAQLGEEDRDAETDRNGDQHGDEGRDQRAVDRRSEERRVGKECRSRWSSYH